MIKITLRMAREACGYSVEEDLPNVLTAQNIAEYLQISRRQTYELLQLPPGQGGIKNFYIGASRRVAKSDFEKWIERQQRLVVVNL